MILLKIGGSLLSPKHTRGVFDRPVAQKISETVAHCDEPLVMAHGVGSIGRRSLGEHRSGPIEDSDRAKKVRNTIARLHRSFVDTLREARCPIETVEPDDLFVLQGGTVVDFDPEPLRAVLQRRRIPLTYGSLVADRDGGYSILSSDVIVEHAAMSLAPERVLWATDVDGVLDPIGRPIREIDPSAPPTTPDDPEDPTGGMSGKLGSIFRIAAGGYESLLFNGGDPAELSEALLGRSGRGTRVVSARRAH